MSSFMETGSILLESATTVERVADALATILPLVPDLKYYRYGDGVFAGGDALLRLTNIFLDINKSESVVIYYPSRVLLLQVFAAGRSVRYAAG